MFKFEATFQITDFCFVLILFVFRRTCSDCGDRTFSSSTNCQVPVQDVKCYNCGVESRWTTRLEGAKYSDTSPDKKKKGSQHWMKFRYIVVIVYVYIKGDLKQTK